MRTADAHSHVIPAGFVERVREEGGPYGYSIRTNPQGIEEVITPDWPDGVAMDVGQHVLRKRSDEEFRRSEMIEAGIDVSIESLLPPLMSYGADERQAAWGARAVNDSLAELAADFSGAVYGMAHVPLQFPALAVAELTRAHDEHGIRAVQIGSNVRNENLDLSEFDPFWDAAQSLGVLVFVHPHHQAAKDRLQRYWLRNLIGNPLETSIAAASLILGGVLARFPDLNVCLAHAGGYAPWIRGRWRHGSEVRAENEAFRATGEFDEYFGRLYFDTLIHDVKALQYMIDTVGYQHVLLGTDYAADMGDWQQVPVIRGLPGIGDVEKEAILGGNALGLIGEEKT